MHLISYLTQRLIFVAIYEKWKNVTLSEAATKLEVSKMSVSRCFDEIEYLNIDILGMKGRSRVITVPTDIRKLWTDMQDVFTDEPVISKQYDIDHFIPWSFVMNDELWNLMPMDSSLNSSKSNRLPKWDPFFIRFAKNQFIMYQLIHEKEGIRKLCESCYRDNLHSIWAGQELYRKGNSEEEFMNILQKNMQPVYDSARRQGYEVWNRG